MSPSDFPEERAQRAPDDFFITLRTIRPHRPWRRRLASFLRHPLVNIVLFLLTGLSIAFIGGWRMCVGLLAILLAHEMGHYVACRKYGVSATLPYFIPAPIFFAGTLGALIFMRGRIPGRKALFDIGIAGPLAGFVVCVPILILGVKEVTIKARATTADNPPGSVFYLSDPLAYDVAWRLLRNEPQSNQEIGPFGLAAWFGLLVTSLNLMPVGQLDGGHILYALFRKRAHRISRLVWWLCVALIYFATSWILWVVLLRVLGRQHPPTLRDDEPLGTGRKVLAIVAGVIFLLTFMPEPILGSWETIRELLFGR